jgi:nitric oxide reductase activation protein
VAQLYINAVASGTSSGLKDGSSALSDAVQSAVTREKKDCRKGESPYRPYSTDKDKVVPVPIHRNGREDVDVLMQSVRRECAFLRARLRSVFRALTEVDVTHGVRRGQMLSDRMLVDSMATMRSGQIPNRAYQRTGEQIDHSLAAVVVLDQSGSMGYGGNVKLTNAVKGVLAIVDPLDSLGCAVEAVGFRDGEYIAPGGAGYHRSAGVDIDVFKGFNERMSTVKGRFAGVKAVGGTPMADGIQYAINTLQTRREGHRVVFVVTDGDPNGGTTTVINRQLRLARESGLHIIGVGIGSEAAYVQRLFDDHVFVKNVSALPRELIRKLHAIVDTRRVKVAGHNRKIATA